MTSQVSKARPGAPRFVVVAVLGYGCDIVAHVDLQELVEEGAVLEHGGAHVFGGDLRAAGALGDGVGGAVVFDDAGMVD